jgi:hypothetical protein
VRKREIGIDIQFKINHILSKGLPGYESLQHAVYSLFNSSVKTDVGGIYPFNELHSVLLTFLLCLYFVL